MPNLKPIAGETPISDFSELRVKGIVNRSQLNEAEAANITKAMSHYFGGTVSKEQAPFDYAWFLQLHREMFGEVWGWAGRLRRSITNIGVEPKFIEQKLYDLSLNLPCWSGENWLQQATMLHHQAVAIHPFENGNGRWSRMLANLWLYRNGQAPVAWPSDTLSEESPVRREYLAAIQAADQGDYESLLALHTRFWHDDE